MNSTFLGEEEMDSTPEKEEEEQTAITPQPPSRRKVQHTVSHFYNGTLSFWPSESGLGNNLYGLASAFLIATLLNKELQSSRLRSKLRVATGNYAYHSAFSVRDYWNKTVIHGRIGL